MGLAGRPIGVQITGTAKFATRASLEASILQAITDAGFSVSQFTVDTPGWTWSFVLTALVQYQYVARVVVDAWTDAPADTSSAIVAAVSSVTTVIGVSTFDVGSGVDTGTPNPSPTASGGDPLSSFFSAVNVDVKFALVAAVVVIVAVVYLKPSVSL